MPHGSMPHGGMPRLRQTTGSWRPAPGGELHECWGQVTLARFKIRGPKIIGFLRTWGIFRCSQRRAFKFGDTHREYPGCWREDLPTWASVTPPWHSSLAQMLSATVQDQHFVAQMEIIANHWFAAIHVWSFFSVLYNSSNIWTTPLCPSTCKLAQATALTA